LTSTPIAAGVSVGISLDGNQVYRDTVITNRMTHRQSANVPCMK
jgi:hypothetical protein